MIFVAPINGIIGMLQVIQRCGDDKQRIKDAYDKMWISSTHLLSLVNDILDIRTFTNGFGCVGK